MHVVPAPETGAPSANAGRLIARSLIPMAALFGGAGRLDWTRGWITVALYAAGMIVVGKIVQHFNPSLRNARAGFLTKDTKPADRFFLRALFFLQVLQHGVAGLDAVRFRWSSMPFGYLYAGATLLLTAMALLGWTLAVNKFAETSVRIQTERGHAVVETGPYGIVRHPMYVALIMAFLATPLLLGSVWALGIAVPMIVLLVWRTAWEDRMLRRELPGYEEYAGRLRFRLLPGLW